MKPRAPHASPAGFEAALQHPDQEPYLLRLYVTGATPKSLRAIQNVRGLCEEHLKGRYHLEVIDLYQQPLLAKQEQIVAAPTLIRYRPSPLRRFVGSMADAQRVLPRLRDPEGTP